MVCTNSKSNTESNILPPLEVSVESGSSGKEEGNGLENEEDWQTSREEESNSDGVAVNIDGDEIWELFSVSGVRHNSI
jgi:hypothetical protein